MPEEDEMLISEVATALSLSHVTVWRHVKAGHLTGRRVGPIYLIKRASFEEFQAQERKPGRPRGSKNRPPAQ